MRRPLCLAALVYVLSALFLLHFYPVSGEDLSEWDRQTACIRGVVAGKEYKVSDDGTVKLLVTLKECVISGADSGGGGLQAEGKERLLRHNILCRAGDGSRESAEELDKTVSIGDAVDAEGILRSFHRASNSGEFDAELYYRTLGYSGQLTGADLWSAEELQRSAAAHTGPWDISMGERLHRLRRGLCAVLDRCMTAKNAGILKAMLLGEKGSLDPEIKNLYQINGIIHILAISGLHISILGMGLYRVLQKLFLRLPLRVGDSLSAVLSVTALLLYGQMTGMGASSFRAIVMVGLRLSAKFLRRTYDLLTGLSLAGVLLVLQQPLYLLHSGFLFSFSAVLGIGLLMPAFSSKWMKGISVSLATLPVYLLFCYRFPIYSVVLNFIVIPMAGTVMAGGLLVLVLGGIWTPAGALAGMLPSGILNFYELLCRFCTGLPGQQVNLGAPGAWQVAAYVLLLVLITCIRDQSTKKEGQRCRAEILRVLLAAAAVFLLCCRQHSGLSLHVIDVGQGDGLLLRAEGENILIDGGSTDQTDVGQYRIIPMLQYYGVREISCVVTHEDEDHISGIRELLSAEDSGIQIKTLYLPSVAKGEESEAYLALEEQAREGNIPVVRLYEGVTVQKGALQLLCLHPEENSTYEEANERSVTLYLTYGSFSCLLTGDLEGAGEDRLLQYAKQASVSLTLLHVAHHGSNGATSEAFLQRFRPLYAYVSCGEGNRYGHPGEEAMSRLQKAGTERIFDTRKTGEITFHVRSNGRKLTVKTYKDEENDEENEE